MISININSINVVSDVININRKGENYGCEN